MRIQYPKWWIVMYRAPVQQKACGNLQFKYRDHTIDCTALITIRKETTNHVLHTVRCKGGITMGHKCFYTGQMEVYSGSLPSNPNHLNAVHMSTGQQHHNSVVQWGHSPKPSIPCLKSWSYSTLVGQEKADTHNHISFTQWCGNSSRKTRNTHCLITTW